MKTAKLLMKLLMDYKFQPKSLLNKIIQIQINNKYNNLKQKFLMTRKKYNNSLLKI